MSSSRCCRLCGKPLLFLAPALKNQETDQLFLNDKDELPESRVVIEKGVAWEYTHKEHQQSVQTQGPLTYRVLLMVRTTIQASPTCRAGLVRPEKPLLAFAVSKVHAQGESKVTVSYKYIIQNHLWSSLESNLLQEDAVLHEWALKKWSHCSRPCGGGLNWWLSSRQLAVVTVVTATRSLLLLFRLQENSIQDSAAGGRLTGKWFTGPSAPMSTNPEPLAATATPIPAPHHGNQCP